MIKKETLAQVLSVGSDHVAVYCFVRSAPKWFYLLTFVVVLLKLYESDKPTKLVDQIFLVSMLSFMSILFLWVTLGDLFRSGLFTFP